MDPKAVFHTLWRYKSFVLPVILVTLLAAVYVLLFAPRSYETSASYAVVNPPTSADELADSPGNSDNPYLRSSSATLITDVLITRLNADVTAEKLQQGKLSTEYTVAPGTGGNGFVVAITAQGSSEKEAVATGSRLGKILQDELYSLQKVYGADDRYLFTSLVISPPDKATELFSSRLRSLIIVLIMGGVLVFAAVSVGRSLTARQITKTPEDGATDDLSPAVSSRRTL